MENRHAIRLRNTLAALWLGFSVPTACIWVLIADRHDWGDRHPVLAIAVLTTFVGPLVFIGWFEHNRRKSKRARGDSHSQSP
jgi:hypothetical protein